MSFSLDRRTVLMSAAALAACGRNEIPADTLRVGVANLPDSLDPARGELSAAALIYYQVHAGLTDYGPDGELAPGLAESWSISPDGLTWTFTLREELAWSDGRPLTAHDIVWSAQRLVDPAESFSDLGDFYAVENARAALAGDVPPQALGVTALNDRMVSFRLTTPLGLFPVLMREFYPFPRHLIERVGDDWVEPEYWVSAGAYKIESVSQTAISLVRNPHYYGRTAVAIPRIEVLSVRDDATRVRLFRAGDLDLAQNPPANQISFLQGELGDRLRGFEAPILRYLKLNHARSPLDQLENRIMLARAVDRDFIAREVFAGSASAAASVLKDSPNTIPPAPDSFQFERPLEIRTTTGMGERIAVALADDWRRIGVETEILVSYPTDLYQAVDAGDFDIAVAGFNRGLKADPFFMLDPFGPTGFAANFNWIDDEFAAIMQAAREENDPALRAETYFAAEARLMEEAAIVTLAHERAHWLVETRVTGTRDSVQPMLWRNLGIAAS